MKPRRRFLLALMASLAFHLGILTSPSWRLPFFDDVLQDEKTTTIDARLVRQSPSSVSAPVRAKPKKPRPAPRAASAVPAVPSAPAEAPAAPLPEQATEPVVDTEAPPNPEVVPLAPVASIDDILPRHARIRYRVTLGTGGFVIGESIQELRHDDASYEMRSSAATTGLAGFFKPVRVVNVSQGEVIGGNLRPREFRIERGTGNADSAVFDWQAARVALSNGRDFPLEPGAQDMLSMFGQLALILGEATVVSLPVVTGKKVERYEFTVLGEERIMTPLGERTTVHLRSGQADSKESTEVWLGLEDARLPVKIRYVDRRGDIYEQIADSIEFDSKTEEGH
jgi:hypothetical protein